MQIDIRQHAGSIGDGYDIFTNNKKTHVAYTQILTFLPLINLAKSGTDEILLSIEAQLSLFGPNYTIIRRGKEYYFETVSYFGKQFSCVVGETTYNIYGHVDNKYSIYKNDIQIGYWTGQMITFLEGDKYKIVANNNASVEFLISFCLIIDNYYHNNNRSLFSFNFSFFGSRRKKFDNNWTPMT